MKSETTADSSATPEAKGHDTSWTAASLKLDPARECARIEAAMQHQVREILRRRGVVVGISGGIDSAVVASLSVRAFGSGRVLGLLMPERDSSSDALRLGRLVASRLGIQAIVEDITPLLDGAGCYRRQTEAIQAIFPDYGPGYRCKVVLPSILASGRVSVSRLTIQSPSGGQRTARMTAESYRQLIAATNFKQRMRKSLEYYHADRLGYVVAGTPNRLEYDQGFFVKQGDGAADVKPIAHLYKTQVYELAAYLDVPAEIRSRPPTTDTFSLGQTQEEFYFSLPYQQMDLCLHAFNQGVTAARVAAATGLTEEQVERVFADIVAKRRATRYLHVPPLLVERVAEV